MPIPNCQSPGNGAGDDWASVAGWAMTAETPRGFALTDGGTIRMKVFVAGLSYKTAPVEVREQLAVRPSLLPCYGCRLKLNAGLDEVVLLSTCNRVEIYGTTSSWVQGKVHRLFRQLCPADVDLTPYLYVKEGAAAVEHLFSVTSGLDSMVIGETEITGQVKNAYQAAQQAGLTGRVLNRLFQTALQIGKEIRTHTGIGRGATSVGSVAVELAEKIFAGDLSDKTVMILGAGKMGEACVRHLAKRGARSVLVANRSLERAQSLAAEFGGRALPFEERMNALDGGGHCGEFHRQPDDGSAQGRNCRNPAGAAEPPVDPD